MTRHTQAHSVAAWSSSDLAGDPHRVADKPQRVRRMFSAIAHRYDLNNRLHSFGRDQAWRRRAVDLVGLRPGEDVLDAACGTGDLAEAFAAAGAGSVVGVDFSARMLELARRKARRIRRPPGGAVPRYVGADVSELPFEDRSFDVVSIGFGIRNVADPLRVMVEFHRVLRPRGRLVVLEFGRPEHRLLRRLSDIYCNHIMPLTATLIAGDRSGAYRYLPRSVATFADGPSFVALVEQAGLRDVSAHPMTFGVCVAYVARRLPDEDRAESRPGRA
jgi:demethylmenaquinone methyltransferase/2-methoxy-6-polyprenyl-1,4-benzoquinol methylase